jgi:hypothetical protein
MAEPGEGWQANARDAESDEAARERRRQALQAMAERQLGLTAGSDSPASTRVAPAVKHGTRQRLGCLWAFLAALVVVATGLAAHSIQGSHRQNTPGSTSATPGVACARAQPPYPNFQVSHDAYLAHSEPMVAENPRNPLNLVGGSKLFTDPAHYRFQIGTFASFDGGCTWTDGGVLPGFRPGVTTSDVSIAFGQRNDVYVAVLYADGAGGGEYGYRDSGIAVSASHDGGRTFGLPVFVARDPTGASFADKPWIAVDQTAGPHSGSVYIVWSDDHDGICDGGGCKQDVAFSRSTDGGKTFLPMRLVEGDAPFCTNPAPGRAPTSLRCDAALGTVPVVEPDGTLVVVYAYEDLLNTRTVPTRMLALASRDGGDTWTSPALIATVADIYGIFRPQHYRNASLPALACDPITGQLYIAWSDKGNGDADVLLSTSHDEGQSWTAPLRVNDDPLADGANQFQPQLAVAPDGVVSVSFFDTRNDPQRGWLDVYLAQSIDHGVSMLPNVRVTTQTWNPAAGAPVDSSGLQFIGDYQGLAADNAHAYPFWNDARTGRQQILTAVVASARP